MHRAVHIILSLDFLAVSIEVGGDFMFGNKEEGKEGK